MPHTLVYVNALLRCFNVCVAMYGISYSSHGEGCRTTNEKFYLVFASGYYDMRKIENDPYTIVYSPKNFNGCNFFLKAKKY